MQKANRKLLSLLLALVMTMSLLAPGMTVAWAAADKTIASAEDFAAFAGEVTEGNDYKGKTIVLAGDIDLSSIADWVPVGTQDKPFAGTFDGAGKNITGLTITDITGGYHGLFGYVTGTLKDFTVSGSISGTQSVDFIGGVVGFNAGTITGVTNKVTVNVTKAYNVGGIAGMHTSGLWVDSNDKKITIEGATGLIENCANLAPVSGWLKVGGIVGENAGTVNACYNTAKVDGYNAGSKNGVGGIAGRNGNNNSAAEVGVISNCYNTAEVGRSGQKWTGGINGFNNAKSSVINCYNIGPNMSTTGYNNPIAGNQEGGKLAENNYSLKGLSSTGNTEAECGKIKTAEEMKAASFIKELCGNGRAYVADTNNINGGYPILRWQAGEDIATVTGLTIENGPTKLTYVKGEKLDTTGLKIKAAYSDGTSEYISDYTVSNAGPYTENCTITITASYGGQSDSKSFDITVLTAAKIAVTKVPTTTVYVAGQTFKTTGMVVSVFYSDNSSVALSGANWTHSPTTALTGTETAITISYTLPDNTVLTTEQPITFVPKALTKVTISTNPKNLVYADDEAIDLTGMVVKAFYNDFPTKGITLEEKSDKNPNGYTWSLGEDKKTLTVSYTDNGVTQTASIEFTRTGGAAPKLVDGAYQLATEGDLIWFANQVNKMGKADANAVLTQDITITTKDALNIGSSSSAPYTGTFDGQGHTITFKLEDAQPSSLFNYLGGTLKNLTTAGEITFTSGINGGMVSTVRGTATVENCVNKANITVTSASVSTSVKGNIGGIVGYVQSTGTLAMKNCVNTGNITGIIQYSGGLVGKASANKNNKTAIIDCANTGNITSTFVSNGFGLGGIVGYSDEPGTTDAYGLTISGCYNIGAITGSNAVGGIIGMAYNATSVSDCYNLGAITMDTNPGTNSRGAGGIIGSILSGGTEKLAMANCYNAGAVKSAKEGLEGFLGELIGYVKVTGGTVTNSYYLSGGNENAMNLASSVTVTMTDVSAKSETELKALASTLGEKFADNSQGYPVLKWQAPTVVAGADASYKKGSGDLSFRFDGGMADLVSVSVDGKELDARNYVLGEDGTITLTEKYLSKLADGKHTISVTYTTGAVSAQFTVSPADVKNGDTVVKTGDMGLALWIAVLPAALLGICIVSKKKREA